MTRLPTMPPEGKLLHPFPRELEIVSCIQREADAEAVLLAATNVGHVIEWVNERINKVDPYVIGAGYWSQPPMRAITGMRLLTPRGERIVNFGEWVVSRQGSFEAYTQSDFRLLYRVVRLDGDAS